jgi:hypothetical protein
VKRITVPVGTLTVGERFWFRDNQYEVMRNNGAKYIHAHAINVLSSIYLEQDQDVYVDRED